MKFPEYGPKVNIEVKDEYLYHQFRTETLKDDVHKAIKQFRKDKRAGFRFSPFQQQFYQNVAIP